MDRLTKLFLGASVLGIAVAILHAVEEVTAVFYYCGGTGPFSCQSVFASAFVSLYGVPLYITGLVWFPLLLFLGYWFTRGGAPLRIEIMLPLLMVGNVFTVYLWYLELALIHSICPVCVSLYLINYFLTGLVVAAALRS